MIHELKAKIADYEALIRDLTDALRAKEGTPYTLHTLHCVCGKTWRLDVYPPKLNEENT